MPLRPAPKRERAFCFFGGGHAARRRRTVTHAMPECDRRDRYGTARVALETDASRADRRAHQTIARPAAAFTGARPGIAGPDCQARDRWRALTRSTPRI